MSRTQKTFTHTAETTVEEEFENKIETFQDVFGGSYGMGSFTEQIVEKAEVSQSIQENQEKIQSKKKEILKLNNLTIAKALINIVLSTAAIVGLATVLGPIFSVPLLILGFPIEIFLVGRIAHKDEVKTFSAQKKINQLRIEILQKHLNGKVLNAPELSNEWNPVKVEKDSEIVEYMVRVVEDSNGMENVESRELKAN